MTPPRSRPRVLVLAPSLDILGGQARQAARLMEYFRAERNVEVDFLPVNPRLPGPFRYLQRIKYVRTVVTTLTYWTMLLVRIRQYDVLHIFSASYYSYLLSAAPAVLLGKLVGKKTVLNYRSGECEDHLRRWRLTGSPIIRLADVVVVPSAYLVDVFARFGIPARAILNTVELDRFVFRDRRPLKPIFLTTRLLEPLYNVGCVLRAFALIQQRYPDARLIVGGDGSMRNELKQLARALCLRNVEFVGGVPFERMPVLHDSADIYLNATNLDNMPASLIECFACGLPVVTTDAGGIPYIVTHERTGLLVPRNDHAAMAIAAIRLLDDQTLAATIARQAWAECAKYSWERVREEWLRLYRDLAARDISR